MRPLLFLTTRSLKNGIRRALTTPRRLISIILFAGYYYWIFIAPGLRNSRGMMDRQQLPAPPMDMLQAVVFALFVVLSILLMLSIFSQLSGFKPADVDILFPTPISPKLVLVFRIFRDYVATLVVPILFAILLFRPAYEGWNMLFAKMPHPEHSAIAIRAMWAAWMLMSLAWILISYALNLSIYRSDPASDRRRRIVNWSLAGIVTCLVLYLWWSLNGVASAKEAIGLADSPILRTFFFTASFASQMAMAPLQGDWMSGAIGASALVAIILVAFKFAVAQSGWMYDQAAAKGFGSLERRKLQQSGDMYAMVASMAREGKLKAVKQGRLHRLRLQGPAALLWKDFFLQTRGMRFMMLMLFALAMFMNLMPAFLPSRGPQSDVSIGAMFVLLQLVTLLMVTLSFAQTGFLEFLRSVDLQKPLPFAPSTTVFMEVLSKSVLGTLAAWLSATVLLIVRPELWSFVLAGAVTAPFLSMLISAATLLMTLTFPDVDDPSQRTLRGLLLMLSIVLFLLPAGMVAGGLLFIKVPMALAAIPVAAINFGATFLVASIAGSLYASYNPSE